MIVRLVLFGLCFLSFTLIQGQSIDKLLLDYNNASDSATRSELELKLAWAYQDQQAYARAVEFYEKALKNKVSDTLQAQKLRASMAICYGELRNSNAEIYIREEMMRYGFQDQNHLVANIQSLSGLYVTVRNYPKAVESNEQLLNESLRLNDYNLITQAYNNLGYIYHLQNNPQKSSEYFSKSYAMAIAPGTGMKDVDRAKVITNLGVTSATLGNLEQAQKYFDEALVVVRRQTDPVNIAKAINYKATGQYLRGETNIAISTLDEGVALLEKAPITEEANAVRSDCYKLMAELMLKKKNIVLFKSYQKKYDLLREQTLQHEKTRNRLLMERQIETERQERDIQRLIAENQKNRVQLVESELIALQKEKELKQKLTELELLKNENELQSTRFQNQALEKERISQLLEIAQQKSIEAEQKQRIDLLQRDKALQELSLAKSKEENELLESTQQQQVKIKKYSFVIIGLLLLLLGIAVRLYFYRHKKNKKLAEQNFMINNLNQEMLAQNEELTSMNEVLNERTEQVEKQNEKLTEAQKIINAQNDKLLSYNKNLELEIEKRTKEIKNTNKELIHYNNQLEQFAFTVSHNIRGPVARLLGLTSLITMTDNPEEREYMISRIDQRSKDLDEIITDLTRILEIKNSEQKKIERIDFNERIGKARLRLESLIQEGKAIIVTDFSKVDILYSVNSCIDSIFYNLISNAVKYRSKDRPCNIEISAVTRGGFVELIVKDNGIGIDLEKYGHQLFSLYKRFNTEVEGRGIGLYLVKAEVESLGGVIEVESAPNKGASFKILLPSNAPENSPKEVLEEKTN
jgi:signal transduction histidine kinase/tetratricopeptide (TPR) repeat protein